MSFGRSLTFFIITVSLVSCLTGKQLDTPAYYKAPAPADTGKLRFDGFYSNTGKPGYPRDRYSAVNPVFFTPKNRIHVSHGANTVTDSSLFTCKYYRQLNPAGLGTYIIEGNKISAFVPVAVAMGEGAWFGIYHLHFSGIIVNKELITNWKALPPFPKRIKKRDMENSQNSGIFSEHDLQFIQADSINCLNP
jgi:hypothetical protein